MVVRAVLLWASAVGAESLPPLKTTSLTGHEVVLPDAARAKVGILIIGFTKRSSEATSAWGRAVERDFGGDPRCMVFQVAVLEDVPRLFRGMVIKGVQKGVPTSLQDRFLTVVQDAEVWKRTVQYVENEPDEAYIVVLGEHGSIRWCEHAAFGGAPYGALREQITRLLSPR